MSEYIERERAVKALAHDYAYAAADLVSKLPKADVVEVKHGRWKFDTDGDPYCSVCGKYAGLLRIESGNYCPNCGADMRGGNDGKE